MQKKKIKYLQCFPVCLRRSDRETGNWTASVYSAFIVEEWQQTHMRIETLSSCLVLMSRPQVPLKTFTGHAVGSWSHNVSHFTPKACFNVSARLIKNIFEMPGKCAISLKIANFVASNMAGKCLNILLKYIRCSHHKMGFFFFFLLQKWL